MDRWSWDDVKDYASILVPWMYVLAFGCVVGFVVGKVT